VTVAFLVVFLNYKGEQIIVRFKSFGTIFLFMAYILFGILVVWDKSEIISYNLNVSETPSAASLGFIIWTGVLYVGYNLAVYPAALFAIKNLKSTAAVWKTSILSGIMMCFPWYLTFFSLMGYYPQSEILEAPVPWIEMLHPFGVFIIVTYGVVVGWTLIETATGIIHAFVIRMDDHLNEITGRNLSGKTKSLVSLVAIALAVVLSRFGIIDLIAKGYSIMAYGMIAVFALPLLGWGIKSVFIRK